MTNFWYSIDPGTRGHGWAGWEGELLFSCGFGNVGPFVSRPSLVIEIPQVYYGSKQKGDANDLVKLAFEAGKVSAEFAGVKTVRPREWKGTVKKEIMLRRIVSRLNDNELYLLKDLGLPSHKEHNVVDAVGIGLWRLGRL